jgi:hypothetical protein
MRSNDIIDQALESIRDSGPELSNGLTNHAPMVVEALCALDRQDAVAGWLEVYRGGLLPAPAPLRAIAPVDWQTALAHPERFADWRQLIEEELKAEPWAAVLDRWVMRLAPGISASAAHGVIRTGHAVRALAAAKTPNRLGELASGLAYWAATYQGQ